MAENKLKDEVAWRKVKAILKFGYEDRFEDIPLPVEKPPALNSDDKKENKAPTTNEDDNKEQQFVKEGKGAINADFIDDEELERRRQDRRMADADSAFHAVGPSLTCSFLAIETMGVS